MGCFWSRQDRERCYSCRRLAVNNLKFIDHQCEICRNREALIKEARALLQNGPCYGEYRCKCGRFWTSRLSWRGMFQICINERCRLHVSASNQRELRQSDWAGVADKPHPREFCQMCQLLGHYCGKYRQGYSTNSGKGRPAVLSRKKSDCDPYRKSQLHFLGRTVAGPQIRNKYKYTAKKHYRGKK